MTLSVIIPARNDRMHLARLQDVLKPGFLAHQIRAEIIVVANGCTDGTEALCDAAGFKLISFEQPLSPGAARNAGARIATGDWFAFLDADVVPLQSWFAAVSKLVSSGVSDVATGWPVLVPPASRWVAVAWERVRMAGGRLPRYINSGNLIVSRRLFEQLSGFDGDRIAGEDADFCVRVEQAKGRLLFDADLATYHYGEPRGLSDFLRRQFFHAEPMRTVLRNSGRSALNAAIVLVFTASCAGLIGALFGWILGWPYAAGLLLVGPWALFFMALGKAASGWAPRMRPLHLAQMVVVCCVMFTARTIGTIWQPRSVRVRA